MIDTTKLRELEQAATPGANCLECGEFEMNGGHCDGSGCIDELGVEL